MTVEVRPFDSLGRFEIDLRTLGAGRQAYLVAARGRIQVNGKQAQPRDGVVVRGEGTIAIDALDDAEILLADLP
jgi:redox-sensitive bicupin YhaK (pirin superfamily)